MAIINGRGRVGIRKRAVAASPSIVLDGLKLYLDAGKATSYPGTGTVWTDLSGNGNNGTLINGPTYNSANAGSIVFDGSNDYASFGTSKLNFGLSNFTLSVWVYMNTTNAVAGFFGKFIQGPGDGRFGIYHSSAAPNKARCMVEFDNNNVYVLDSLSNINNANTNITVTFQRNGFIKMYINGNYESQIDISSLSNISLNSALNLDSGMYRDASGNPANFLNGKIYTQLAYDRVLSATEVLQNYNSLLGRFYPIVSDSDAQAFVVAAGLTSSTQATAINTLVTSLKSAGIWTKMKAVYPMVGGSAASHKFNLKDPRDLNAAYRLVFTAGWVHSSTGAKPNGSGDYANTFFNSLVNFSTSNASLSYYSRTSLMKGNASTALLGNVNGSIGLILRNDYYSFSQAIMTNALGAYRSDLYPSTNGTGLWSANRTSSVASSLRLWRNGVAVGTTPTLTDCTFPNLNVYLAALNSGGSDTNYSNHECAFASLGDGLSDTEAASLYTAVQAYQTSLGRQV